MTYKELAETIARKVEDPNDWALTLRRLIGGAQGDVTQHMPIGSVTLQDLCWQAMSSISKRAGLSDQFQAVIKAYAAS
jgi:hypothetical protein